jgi:hypothetical protein
LKGCPSFKVQSIGHFNTPACGDAIDVFILGNYWNTLAASTLLILFVEMSNLKKKSKFCEENDESFEIFKNILFLK